jgi:hypothetical protein
MELVSETSRELSLAATSMGQENRGRSSAARTTSSASETSPRSSRRLGVRMNVPYMLGTSAKLQARTPWARVRRALQRRLRLGTKAGRRACVSMYFNVY